MKIDWTKSIDWTKPIETTDGDACVHIQNTERPECHWVAIWHGKLLQWHCHIKHESQLRNVREKRRLEGWLNVYGPNSAHFYDKKPDADAVGDNIRLGCIRIDHEYTVGEAGDD